MGSDTMSVSINVEEGAIPDNFRQLTSEVKISCHRSGSESGGEGIQQVGGHFAIYGPCSGFQVEV